MWLIARRAIVVTGALLVVTTIAAAEDVTSDRLPGNDASLRDTPAVNSALPAPLPAARGSNEGDLGEHLVTGKVRQIDTNTGLLVVDVKGKDLRVLFPPSALDRLDEGDEVTVTVGIHKNDSPGR